MIVAVGIAFSLAAATLMVAVAWMNALFLSQFGASREEGILLGAASVSVDVMLALTGVLIVWGNNNQRRVYVFVVAGLAAMLALLSTVSALGYLAQSREASVASRETETLVITTARTAVEHIRQQRSNLGSLAPKAVVDAELKSLTLDRRWGATKGCRSRARDDNVAYCDRVQVVQRQATAASAAEQLDAELRDTIAALAAAQRSASGRPEAQISFISEQTGLAERHVRLAVVLLAGITFELGAALGVGLGLSPWLVSRESRKQKLARPDPRDHLARSDELTKEEEGHSNEDGHARTSADDARRRWRGVRR